MKKYSHLYLLIAVILLPAACKKDDNGNDDDRPAYYWSETTCTINGQLWGDCEPSMFIRGGHSAETSAQLLGDGVLISAANFCRDIRRTDVYEVYIRTFFDVEVGSYVLGDFHYGGVSLTATVSRDTIETNETYTGELIIDKFEGKRISGRFHFQAYHKQKDSVYVIANGKFDNVFVYNLE